MGDNSSADCDIRSCEDPVTYQIEPVDPFELEEQIEAVVVELDDKSGYAFDYDVPLDGEWSYETNCKSSARINVGGVSL